MILDPNEARGTSFEITLQELTDMLECSGRRKGRGNRSQMTFMVSRESIVQQIAEEYVEKGDLKQAFSFLDEYVH